MYHGALRFITNFKYLTHHCFLYEGDGWSSVSTHGLKHWYILVYKDIHALLPLYLLTFISQRGSGTDRLHSQDVFSLSVSRVTTELRKKALNLLLHLPGTNCKRLETSRPGLIGCFYENVGWLGGRHICL